MINGKKHTPGSNTLKKMKRKAAMEAAAKKATADKPKAKKAKTKAPVPRPRSERPSKSRKPGDAREYSSFDKKSSSSSAPVPRPRSERPTKMTKLKGKVADLPSKKKAAMTAGADAKVKADAAREKVLKKSKGSAADIAYAKKIRGI
jgi:hypothetical protein